MNFLRKHWFDIGGALAIVVLAITLISYSQLSNYQSLMWISLVTLFLHQLEEYRVVGTFPGMINSAIFNSKQPDRFPLNTNTSLIINVWLGWSIYLLAAILGEKAVWLGMATIVISLGNFVIHTTFFNIKGKTLYNAGMATSVILFAPCAFFFFKIIATEHLATSTDYIIGISLGIIFNVFGVVKPVTWLSDKNTSYIFEKRNLLKQDREKV